MNQSAFSTVFRITRDPFLRDGFELRMANRSPDGRISVIEQISVRQLSDDEAAVELPPLAVMSPDDARGLMDELWAAGVRPSEHGSPGQLAAVERHLADLRALVFDLPPHPRVAKPERTSVVEDGDGVRHEITYR